MLCKARVQVLIGPVLHGMAYSASFQERAARNNEPLQRDDVKAVAKNWSEDRFLIAGPERRSAPENLRAARRECGEDKIQRPFRTTPFTAGEQTALRG